MLAVLELMAKEQHRVGIFAKISEFIVHEKFVYYSSDDSKFMHIAQYMYV
jgi:hypothetical protein